MVVRIITFGAKRALTFWGSENCAGVITAIRRYAANCDMLVAVGRALPPCRGFEMKADALDWKCCTCEATADMGWDW